MYAADSALAQVTMSGAMPKVSVPPVVAGAAEAADHLVGDQEDVVFLEHGADLGEIGCWRHDDAAPRP